MHTKVFAEGRSRSAVASPYTITNRTFVLALFTQKSAAVESGRQNERRLGYGWCSWERYGAKEMHLRRKCPGGIMLRMWPIFSCTATTLRELATSR